MSTFESQHDRLCKDLDVLRPRHRRLIEDLGPTRAMVTHRFEVPTPVGSAIR